MPNSTALRQKRAKLVAEGRSVLEAAKKENRGLDAAEKEQDDLRMMEIRNLKTEIEGMEAEERRSSFYRDEFSEMGRKEHRLSQHSDPGGKNPRRPLVVECVRKNIYGRKRADRVQRWKFKAGSPEWVRGQDKAREKYRDWMRGDLSNNGLKAALQTDIATSGGYLVMPEQLQAELIAELDDMLWVRQLSRTFTTTAHSLGTPKRDGQMTTMDWSGELTPPIPDTALTFEKRVLQPHYLTGAILVSNDLMASAIMSPETIVMSEFARDGGYKEEAAFMEGTGATQPLGLFTASAAGIPTTRDTPTATTVVLAADDLITVKFTLKQQYRMDPSCGWIFHRDRIGEITKLTDSENQYLWQPGLQLGTPDRLLGLPIYESEFAPSTVVIGGYVGLIGCMRFYWIADSTIVQMQRLIEHYAFSNQVAFLMRRKVDGMPVLEEGFSRLVYS